MCTYFQWRARECLMEGVIITNKEETVSTVLSPPYNSRVSLSEVQ